MNTFASTRSHRRWVTGLLGLSALGVICRPLNALAQSPSAGNLINYPTKPIRLIVPYSAGGGADNTARLIATAMSAELGQNLLIDNRPGASGVIGAQAVAKSTADGYTVLYDTFPFAVNAALRKLPFDPIKDLVPVSQAVNAPNILVVPTSAPYQTFAEFLTFARANPGKLTYASYGVGGAAHLAGELLKNQAGIDLLHVPYKGGAPALADVMGGQVNAYFANSASGLSYVKAGRLRALAVTSAKRMAALPDVPTIMESGFKDFELLEWNGLFVPRDTPLDIVSRLSAVTKSAIDHPDVRQQLLALGLEPVGNSPTQFEAFIKAQMVRWSSLAKANGIVLGD